MKKIIILIAFGFLFQNAIAENGNDSISKFSFAFKSSAFKSLKCDACGSATGGSMGFSSMLSSNFIGLRYFYQRYESRDGIFANSPKIAEHFNTIQIWTRIPITEKLQLSAFVPYHSHNRKLTAGNRDISGIGDITILGMATVYETKSDSATFSHKLQLGGGLKIPTGEYRSSNNEGTVNPGFQLGSGSLDYVLAAEYVLKTKNIGFNAMLNYNLKTENNKEYKFGNQLNYGGTFFTLYKLKKVRLMPQLGLAGEVYESNRQHDQYLPDTSGDILFSKFGIETGLDNFSLGLNAMIPISQNLTGGNVDAKYRWSVNLNYTL